MSISGDGFEAKLGTSTYFVKKTLKMSIYGDGFEAKLGTST